MDIYSERLAYWFLRLNGFLTTANFVVHADSGVGQFTDVDVLGVRFPFRLENQIRPMVDDRLLVDQTRIEVVLAEAKMGRATFNRAWTEEDRGNMRRMLSAVGPFQGERLDSACAGLYSSGEWTDGTYWVRMLAFGNQPNRTMAHGPLRAVPQFLWREEVLPFIHERFWSYRNEKRYNQQWDDDAKNLFRAMLKHGADVAGFVREVNVTE